jgi:hypothetical protein
VGELEHLKLKHDKLKLNLLTIALLYKSIQACSSLQAAHAIKGTQKRKHPVVSACSSSQV